jgi:hypothetical protein
MNLVKLTAIAAYATIALGASSAALAQEATPEPATLSAPASTLSRADVKAEFLRTKTTADFDYATTGYIQPLKSSVTRAAVIAELREAARTGELAAIQAEAYGHGPVMAFKAPQLAPAWVALK